MHFSAMPAPKYKGNHRGGNAGRASARGTRPVARDNKKTGEGSDDDDSDASGSGSGSGEGSGSEDDEKKKEDDGKAKGDAAAAGSASSSASSSSATATATATAATSKGKAPATAANVRDVQGMAQSPNTENGTGGGRRRGTKPQGLAQGCGWSDPGREPERAQKAGPGHQGRVIAT